MVASEETNQELVAVEVVAMGLEGMVVMVELEKAVEILMVEVKERLGGIRDGGGRRGLGGSNDGGGE